MPRPPLRNRGFSDPNTHGRMAEISRLIARLPRHGQRPEEGPRLDYTPRREVYIHHLAIHPKFDELDSSAVDIRQLPVAFADHPKQRTYLRYEANSQTSLVGVYNGHSVPEIHEPVASSTEKQP